MGFPGHVLGVPHVASRDQLTIGFLNICSITSKLEELLDVRRDRSIDVLCLAETWHDADCAGFD